MSSENPYAPPTSHVEDINAEGTDLILAASPKSNSAGAAWAWIKSGFASFKASPLFWIINMIIMFIIMVLFGLIPVLGSVATSVLNPVFMGGLMIGTYAIAKGQKMTVGHLFAGFQKHAGALLTVGALYLLGIIVLLLLTAVIAYMTGGFDSFSTLAAAQAGGNPDPAEIMAAYGSLKIAGLFYLILLFPLMFIVIFAPALVVFHDMKALAAMKLSFKGCVKNILPLIIWFVLIVIFMILGAIPLGLGLLIVFPMITASTYAAYRMIFTD
ncbi:MAG: hypothetical protein DSZ29_03890 [Aquificaceae bacterium]|nr:MAG: hypothetical protein DSZ29_03890 [Aquificaceae bacterium]